MRIRCRQNAPERSMRVAAKSYSFCLSFFFAYRFDGAFACSTRVHSLSRAVIHFANRFVQTFVCSTRMHRKSFPDVQAPKQSEAA